MAPSYCFILDPMDCIHEKRSSLSKRAPPADAPHPPPPPPASQPVPAPGTTTGPTPAIGNGSNASSPNVAVIIGATLGSLALVFGLALFYCCMRKRRASRRIGQLQHFLPTFMDQEKTEKYFQHHNSSSTLVVPGTNPANTSGNGAKDPAQLTNAHHRVRSAPVAFAKGVTDHRNRQLERDGSLGQFQQISLASDSDAVIPPHVHDQKDEVIPRRSLSGNGQGGSFRARASTITAPAPVVSSLHRSVSLNKHGSRPINSRSHLEDEEDDDPTQTDRFAEGESLIAPNRFSTLLELSPADLNNLNNASRFSATSYNGGLDPVFDPTRYSTASVMFDAKRISNLSTASSEDSVSESSSSDEFNNNLPPHQKHHSFHSHHNSPTMRSHEIAATDVSSSSGPIVPNHPAYIGDKQELDDDDDDVHAPTQQMPPQFHMSTPSSISRQGTSSGYPQQQGGAPAFYPQQQQHQQHTGWPSSNMPLPMAMPVPQPYQPPSVLVSQASDGEGDAR